MPFLRRFLLSILTLAPLCASAQDFDFAPIDVDAEKATKQDLNEAQRAYKRKDFLRASLILHKIVTRNEIAVSPAEQKSEYSLGKTLYRLGLYQASMTYFGRVVEAGPEHRYYRATCKWLYYLSRKISGDSTMLEKIVKYRPDDCPADFRSELAFLIGQYHYQQGDLPHSIEFLRQVDAGSRYFPKAKFLEGMTLMRQGYPQPSIAVFKQLIEAAKGSSQLTEDMKYFSQLATLSIARIYYGMNAFPQAVQYYDSIPLDSPLWLDALFEASWTFFRMNNHEKALGNLLTLGSSFFTDEYVPEAGILKAVIFFSNCNYEKARDALNEFRATYEPLRDEIQGYIASYEDPVELYNYLNKMQDSGEAISPRVQQILNAAFQDKSLKRLNAYMRELDREKDLITSSKSSWSKSQLAEEILSDTEFVRSYGVAEAGRLTQQQLQGVVNELNDLLSQAQKIEIEILTAEAVNLENPMRAAGFINHSTSSGPVYATDDEHIYWPFTGEFWRDELGYYLYTIKSECGR